MTRSLATILLLFTLTGPAFAIDPLLEAKVDKAVATIHARELKADIDTPWVIMHATIAFEKSLNVTRADGSKVNAIEFLLNEAKDGDGPLYRYGDAVPDQPEGIPMIRTRDTTPGFKKSFLVQDHVDQFLYGYADANISLAATGKSGDREFTVATLLDGAKRHFKPTQELGWTLVVTSHYLPIDAKWKTDAGEEIDTAHIMALAVKRDTNRETEGGPHHLYGVAYALARYQAAHPDKELAGPWKDARAYLNKHIALARKYQNDDGSFSSSMFRGQAIARSPRALVWSTGHTIEWLCLALPAEELRKPWMAKAVGRLADEINRVDIETLSKGGLYHAAHAMRLWRERTGG